MRPEALYVLQSAFRNPKSKMPPLVLGTHNRKKAVELGDLVAPLGLDVVTLADLAHALDVDEDGQTFAENACKKARQQAIQLERWVLAEDSGLCVDALEGRPGVFSARFAGEKATDGDNNRRLLDELEGVSPDKRSAHYACHMALADPTGEIRGESHGTCGGRIRTEPVGTNGFGYDPLFEIVELHRTFGELPAVVKRAISHRARALTQISYYLRALRV